MKKVLLVLSTIVLLVLSACSGISSQNREMDSYDKFHVSIGKFIENYSSEHYKFISPEQLTITIFGLPDSKIDSSEDGSINNHNNITLLDMYFIDNDERILIKANFMYLPSNLSNQFIAINSVDNRDNANILEEFHKIDRPNYTEYIIYYEDTLIALNYFDLTNGESESFIDLGVKFYNEFEAQVIETFDSF